MGPGMIEPSLAYTHANTIKNAQALLSNHKRKPNTHHIRKPKFSTDRGAEEAVGEEQLVVGVPGLGGDAQVKEADPGLQLAVEIHRLRG